MCDASGIEDKYPMLAVTHPENPSQVLWEPGEEEGRGREVHWDKRWHAVCPFEVTSGHL